MNGKINILLFFAVHGRHEILKICINGIIALISACKDRFSIVPFAVCSTPEDDQFLTDYSIPHHVFPNDPLGAKKNAGLAEALNQYPELDYMLEIGSDDIISPRLLDLYEPFMREKVHIISCNRAYLLDIRTGKMATWTSDMIIGAGRCLHKSILDRMYKTEFRFSTSIGGLDFNYRPQQLAWIAPNSAKIYEHFRFGTKTGNSAFVLWTNEKQRGLDTDSLHNCLKSGVCNHKQVETEEALIIDLKSDDNINLLDKMIETEIAIEKPLTEFDPSIIDGLNGFNRLIRLKGLTKPDVKKQSVKKVKK